MLQEPKVSIIIPVKNAGRTINKMFDYLYDLDYPENKMEIVIADGGSTDDTIAIIKEWQRKHKNIKYTEVENCVSPGFARNHALKLVTGEYLLFTDGDCAPKKDWIREILKQFFYDPKIGGVGGEVLTLKVEENNLIESYCEQTRFLSPTGRCGLFESGYMPDIKGKFPSEVDGSDRCPFFATANVAFSKEAMEKAGGEFWHQETGEDVDFSLRVLAAGFKLYYQKEAVVLHMHRATLKNFMRQYYYYGYGHPLLLSTHAARIFEIIIQPLGNLSFKIKAEQPGILNLGWFHLLHIFGLFLVLSLLLQSFDWAVLFGALAIISIARYFWPCLNLSPKKHFFTWCRIRYLTNLSFLRGALFEGRKKFKSFCLEPSW